MRRALLCFVTSCAVLGVAMLAAGSATHIYYTVTSFTFMLDDPANYITHQADGWLFLEGAPIGGNYVREYDDVQVPGAVLVEVNGKFSEDGANGNFHGPVSLLIDDMECVGRFRAIRVDYFESGSWVLQCPDGSKIQDTFHFVFTGDPTWIVEGTGHLVIPHGE